VKLACLSRASRVALLLAPLFGWLAPGRAVAQSSPSPTVSCAVASAEPTAVADTSDPPAVEVVVSGEQGRWLATLRVRYGNGSSGTRRISARSCAELQRAVAVTLSLLDPASALPEPDAPLAVDGSARQSALQQSAVQQSAPQLAPERANTAVAAATVPARASPSSVASPPAAARSLAAPELRAGVVGREVEGPTPEAPRVAPSPLEGFVRASSLVAIAGSRFGELGAALASGVWLGTWGARLELSARRPLAKLTAAHDFTLQLERYTAAVEPCARLSGAVELAVCGGPRLELLRGLAVGPSVPESDLVWLPGVGSGSWLRLPVSASWSLSAELQASWSLRRAQASVVPWGRVYELPRFGAGLLLGAEWAL
jgi:hypothetical protein